MNKLNITDLNEEQKIIPILRLGFRPFFLFGNSFALFAVAMWLIMLNGNKTLAPLNGSVWWHSHEMLFGFVPAIVAGFLLTAVQTWTGIHGIKGIKLLFLCILWLIARVLLITNPDINLSIIMAVDLAFLPLTAVFLGLPLIKIAQYRNMIFIPILLFMTLANTLTYLPQYGYDPVLAKQGFHGMVLIITFLVAFLGGRVIPMFTANGTGTAKVAPLKWLEIMALLSLLLLFGILISGTTQNTNLVAALCLLSAMLNLFRQLRWRPWVTLHVPLVWSLHLSMLFIPIGLLLMGWHFMTANISFSAAMHSLTVGGIGGMILAMTSRVSLGHTGRVLQVGWLMHFAFIAIILAAVTRSILVAIWPQYSMQLWVISGGLWCLTFSCFVVVYMPILSAPRIDGRPG